MSGSPQCTLCVIPNRGCTATWNHAHHGRAGFAERALLGAKASPQAVSVGRPGAGAGLVHQDQRFGTGVELAVLHSSKPDLSHAESGSR